MKHRGGISVLEVLYLVFYTAPAFILLLFCMIVHPRKSGRKCLRMGVILFSFVAAIREFAEGDQK